VGSLLAGRPVPVGLSRASGASRTLPPGRSRRPAACRPTVTGGSLPNGRPHQDRADAAATGTPMVSSSACRSYVSRIGRGGASGGGQERSSLARSSCSSSRPKPCPASHRAAPP
jgi:hypothetical protein